MALFARRVTYLLLVFVLSAPAAYACENYECLTSSTSGSCWIRFGPEARQFPYVTECIVKSDCMGGSCAYWCEYQMPCFDV